MCVNICTLGKQKFHHCDKAGRGRYQERRIAFLVASLQVCAAIDKDLGDGAPLMAMLPATVAKEHQRSKVEGISQGW